jgi:hypothetical protein
VVFIILLGTGKIDAETFQVNYFQNNAEFVNQELKEHLH